MQKIQMVDLHGQYLKIKDEIDDAIQDVINTSAFINGPQVKNLNVNLSEYLGCRYTVSCANGTDALQIALMALNLEPGDEVIVPDFTFIATAEVIALLKLKPVFVDVHPETFLLDIDQFSKAITNRTKAVIPVHLYGQCCNMEQILKIAGEHGIYVIEDNAQAFGAEINTNDGWQKAGTFGHIGCTSFFPSKNLGCYGDGGAIFTNNENLAKDIASIANHGAKVKYYHDMVGVNSRLDTLQAAILLVKLKRINEYIKARQEAAGRYDTLLGKVNQIKIPSRVPHSTHVFHQYTLIVEGRDELQKFLAARDIPTMIYYPVGMHNQLAYRTNDNFKASDTLCKSVLSLPMHTELDFSQQEYITESIKEFYAK
jgi:dTDP-4-amino-4,6-dideoxygalactose transaminase